MRARLMLLPRLPAAIYFFRYASPCFFADFAATPPAIRFFDLAPPLLAPRHVSIFLFFDFRHAASFLRCRHACYYATVTFRRRHFAFFIAFALMPCLLSAPADFRRRYFAFFTTPARCCHADCLPIFSATPFDDAARSRFPSVHASRPLPLRRFSCRGSPPCHFRYDAGT